MILFKDSKLSQKDKNMIVGVLTDCTDTYGDAYITQNNLRLFIKENPNLLFDCVKRGDKLAFSEKGIGIVLGYSDNSSRKYLKLLATEEKEIPALIKRVSWDVNDSIYMKIKKNNPIRKIIEKHGFRFAGNRGKEILLVKNKLTKFKKSNTGANIDSRSK